LYDTRIAKCLGVKTISLRMPDRILEEVDELVKQGVYASRTEAIREGARLLLRAQIGSLPGKPVEVSNDDLWTEFLREKKPR